MKTDQFFTVKALADRLAVTPMTIYRLVGQGKLPAVKIGRAIRFDPDAVAAFLAAVRVGPDGVKDGNQEGGKA
jgi:excisionase family DNA binding protein